MSRICFVCNKRPRVANHVSHAKNKTKRWLYPNVQKMCFVLSGDVAAKVHRKKVCTKCLKGHKVRKVN